MRSRPVARKRAALRAEKREAALQYLERLPPPRRVERKSTLAQDVYQRLSHDIVSGRLIPGQKLAFDMLRQEYGYGISPLREALQRLSSESLVVAEGRIGFRVAPISLEDLEEINGLRLVLEPMALRDSVRHGTIEWETAVLAAAHRLAKMSLPKDAHDDSADAWERCHQEFHDTLISACSSRWLLHFCRTLFAQFGRYRRLILARYWVSSPLRGTIDAEHKRVIEAALQRDADKAAQLLHQHYANSGERVAAEFRRLIARQRP
jgi:DNA-binding GntR family transcriptional regulator